MSLSSIFARIDDLDRKIGSLAAETARVSGAGAGTGATVDVEKLLQRLDAVEAVVAAFSQPDIDMVNSRLAALESKVMPDDLLSNMAAFQNAVTGHSGDILALAQKLSHLETVTLPHILTRLENVEHQLAQAQVQSQ